MKVKPLVEAVSATLGVAVLSASACANPTVEAVEFVGMAAPATVDEKTDVYTKAQVIYRYTDGKAKTYDLAYHQIMATTEVINGIMVGGLFDQKDAPLIDNNGQMASDAADGTSLLHIPGMQAADTARNNPLALVTQFEYRELPPKDGVSSGSFWSKLPVTPGLAKLDQDKRTGVLRVVDYSPISFRAVNGGWIHCGATASAWNTHLGSEEYEPDAKTREGLPRARDSDDTTDIANFSRYFFGNAATANAYHYGVLPEISVDKDGKAKVVKHYAPGRYAREMVELAADHRTHIGGDDGKNTGLFMFVADAAKDLSAGTLYAAKVTQTDAASGGRFDLAWVRLGHATDAEVEALVDGGIRFSEIFDVSLKDLGDASYTKVTTYTGTEWLRLKPGMEKAAAFLETRRYAALLGATTEFFKVEYIAYNDSDRKFYLTISRVEAGMTDDRGDIQVARNDGGIILEMSTANGRKDMQGNLIPSDFVGTTLASIPELVGGWMGGVKDAEGNACEQGKLCGPDNLRYVDAIRTLFIGEDTNRRNNNYVWAFNIDTRKLSRILSVPVGAEATGLTIVPNQNGFAYITSNFQHPGEDSLNNYKGADKEKVLEVINAKWNDRKKAAIGYIGLADGALPAMN